MADTHEAHRTPRWLRDPLVVFFLIGAGVFAFDRWRGPGNEASRTIEITESQVDGIRARWAAQFGRPPNDDELRALIDEAVKEEVLYREAQRLALDRDDAIVRRRLAQKMTFLLEDTAEMDTPTDPEIEAYYTKHMERYREPNRTTFVHVFLSNDRRDDPTDDAHALLRRLRDDDEGWRQLGDPFMLLREYADRTDREITELFGRRFTDGTAQLAARAWSGPVISAYGTHLVRVISRTESMMPGLDQVRLQVIEDLQQARRAEQNQAAFEAVRERYEVQLPAVW